MENNGTNNRDLLKEKINKMHTIFHSAIFLGLAHKNGHINSYRQKNGLDVNSVIINEYFKLCNSNVIAINNDIRNINILDVASAPKHLDVIKDELSSFKNKLSSWMNKYANGRDIESENFKNDLIRNFNDSTFFQYLEEKISILNKIEEMLEELRTQDYSFQNLTNEESLNISNENKRLIEELSVIDSKIERIYHEYVSKLLSKTLKNNPDLNKKLTSIINQTKFSFNSELKIDKKNQTKFNKTIFLEKVNETRTILIQVRNGLEILMNNYVNGRNYDDETLQNDFKKDFGTTSNPTLYTINLVTECTEYLDKQVSKITQNQVTNEIQPKKHGAFKIVGSAANLDITPNKKLLINNQTEATTNIGRPFQPTIITMQNESKDKTDSDDTIYLGSKASSSSNQSRYSNTQNPNVDSNTHASNEEIAFQTLKKRKLDDIIVKLSNKASQSNQIPEFISLEEYAEMKKIKLNTTPFE
jgi:hypothetical protein